MESPFLTNQIQNLLHQAREDNFNRLNSLINATDLIDIQSQIEELSEEELDTLTDEVARLDLNRLILFNDKLLQFAKDMYRDDNYEFSRKIVYLMDRISEKSKSFLIKCQIDSIKSQMLAFSQKWTSDNIVAYELSAPDLFALLQPTQDGEFSARPRGKIFKENSDLWRQLTPSGNNDIKVLHRSSSDTIAGFDKHLNPIGLANLNAPLKPPSGIRLDKLMNLIRKIDKNIGAYSLAVYLTRYIFKDMNMEEIDSLVKALFPYPKEQEAFYEFIKTTKEITVIERKIAKIRRKDDRETLSINMKTFIDEGLKVIQKLDPPVKNGIDPILMEEVLNEKLDTKTRYNLLSKVFEFIEPVLETRSKISEKDRRLFWEYQSLMDDLYEKQGKFIHRKVTWGDLQDKLDNLETKQYKEFKTAMPDGEQNFINMLLSIVNVYLAKQKKHNDKIKFHRIEETVDKTMPIELSVNEKGIISNLMKGFLLPHVLNFIQKELNLDITKLKLKSQIYFFRYLLHCDEQNWESLKRIITRGNMDEEYRIQILDSFLTTYTDPGFGNTILKLAQNSLSRVVFDNVSLLIKDIEKNAEELYKNQSEFSYSEIFNGLLQRAKDLLIEADGIIKKEKDQTKCRILLDGIVEGIKKEKKGQSVIRSFFIAISQSLSGGQADLRKFSKMQKAVSEKFQNGPVRNLLLKALHARDSLAPVPEIHWRINRTGKEYSRRFGFDVKKFLKQFQTSENKQLLLEFGPGNGTFKQSRNKDMTGYTDLALCDKLYYPLDDLIYGIINFEKLEEETGPLTLKEKKLICEFIYKIIVMKNGQTDNDQFEYDQGSILVLNKNPGNLLKILKDKIGLLASTETIPKTISSRDDKGNVIYPYKTRKPLNQRFHKACELLSSGFEKYLKEPIEKINIYDYIPAYPPGVIVSDFENIKNLDNDQIDVSFGVRSTVYLKDKKYIQFIKNITDKLNNRGIYIDDNVRDNDGWYYRLAELKEAQKSINQQIHIITGPGFPGEDYNQKGKVPLAVVISKSDEKLNYIKSNLTKGFEIHTLDELLSDQDYLASLDSTGRVLKSIIPAFNIAA